MDRRLEKKRRKEAKKDLTAALFTGLSRSSIDALFDTLKGVSDRAEQKALVRENVYLKFTIACTPSLMEDFLEIYNYKGHFKNGQMVGESRYGERLTVKEHNDVKARYGTRMPNDIPWDEDDPSGAQLAKCKPWAVFHSLDDM